LNNNPLQLPFSGVETKNIKLYFRKRLLEKFGWCKLYHHHFSAIFHDMVLVVVAIWYESIVDVAMNISFRHRAGILNRKIGELPLEIINLIFNKSRFDWFDDVAISGARD
jgi:hypothetical protein